MSVRKGVKIKNGRVDGPEIVSLHLNPTALSMAKILSSVGRSECNRVNMKILPFLGLRCQLQHFLK